MSEWLAGLLIAFLAVAAAFFCRLGGIGAMFDLALKIYLR